MVHDEKMITLLGKTEQLNMPWAIQIIQNIISMSSMVPIRIFDFSKMEKILKELKDSSILSNQEISRWKFKPNAEIKTIPNRKSLCSFFKTRDNSPWVTRSSYPHPLIEHFRLEKIFQIWEYFNIFSHIENFEKNEQNGKVEIYLDHMWIGLKKIEGIHHNYYAIIGPVFCAPPELEVGLFKKKHLLPFIKKYNFFLENNDQILIDSEQTFSNLLSNSTLRPWWVKKDIEHVLKYTSKALAISFNLTLPHSFKITRSLCRMLGVTSWILGSKTLENKFRFLSNSLNSKDVSETYKSIEITVPYEKDVHFSSSDYSVSSTFDGKIWNICLKEDEDCRNEIYLTVNRSRYQNDLFPSFSRKSIQNIDELIKIIEAELNYYYRNVQRRVISLEQSYSQEKLLSLLNWINKTFGVILADISFGSELPLRPFCERISSEVLSLVNSDICEIYFYDYPKEVVKIIGYSVDYSIRRDANSYDQMIKILKNVESVPIESDDRNDSMNYRVVDEARSCFCQASLEKNGEYYFIPKTEKMITGSLGILHSGISVPITVNKRILGVLGISGLKPFQFRNENVQILKHFSQILAPYIYRALFISCIGRLSERILNEKLTTTKKLKYICEDYCSILFSFASALWVPDENNPNIFSPQGWSNNRNDFETTNEKGMTFNKKDRTSVYYHAYGNEILPTEFRNVNIKKIIANDNRWADATNHREWLIKNNINEITILPIISQRKGALVALLLLYYKAPNKGLDKKWTSVINFLSDYLSLLIDALIVKDSQDWQERVNNIINHELKQNIDNVHGSSQNIIRFFQGTEKVLPSELETIISALSSQVNTLHNLFGKVSSPKLMSDFISRKKHALSIIYDLEDEKEEKINLVKLLKNQISRTWKKQKIKNLRMAYSGPDAGVYINIPPSSIRSILNNLVENAILYAIKNSNIKITLYLKKFSLYITVENYGEKLNDINDIYLLMLEDFRGCNSTNIDGSGKGLAISKTLAQRYDGDLSVNVIPKESDENIWKYIFKINFPRHKRVTSN